MSCCNKTSALNYSDEKNTVDASLRMNNYDPYPELQNSLVAYGGCYPSQAKLRENYDPILLKRTPRGFQMTVEKYGYNKDRNNFSTLSNTWHVQTKYEW